MLQHEISKEQVMVIAEKLKDWLSFDNEDDRNLIKKGLHLYRQGSVYNVKEYNDSIIGRVQDVVPVDVTIPIDFIEVSSCTCPVEDLCRHRLALFFYVYSTVGSVGNLLEEWKSGKSASTENRKKLINELKGVEKKYDEASIESWYSFFDSEFDKFIRSNPGFNQYMIANIYTRFFQTVKSKAPKNNELTRLFTLHAALYSITHILEIVEELQIKHYQYDTFVVPYVHNLIDHVVDDVNEMKSVALSFSMDKLLEETMERIRHPLLMNASFKFERFSLYRIIWFVLLNRKKWIEQEKIQLEEQIRAGSLEMGGILALAHLAFLKKNDEKAIRYIEALGLDVITYSFWWIRVLSDAKLWKRTEKWVNYSMSYIKDVILNIHSYEGRMHVSRLFLNEIASYSAENDEKVYIDALNKLLPYSFVEYDHYLLHTNDYRSWVELQLIVGYDIEDIDRQTIKDIEDIDRYALLPLYHQAVSKAIKLKNRPSYKRAVKYLRKLRTHYRKLKQEDTWKRYIEKLAATNKRLRAFQEELIKANMISNK